MNTCCDDILIDSEGNEVSVTQISLAVTVEMASRFEYAAFREGMTQDELLQCLLKDYLNHTGIWS